MAARATADEICICGDSAYTYCDGTMEHYISECHFVNNNYCGYDDLTIGDCPAATPLRPTESLGQYDVVKPKLPPALEKLIRERQIKKP